MAKMCKIHIFLSQEFLSLTENMPLRSSPLHEAAERYAQVYEKPYNSHFVFKFELLPKA
jgi:hypothetical protein